MSQSSFRLAVIGAGMRGLTYARLAAESGAEIAAVAEPDLRKQRRLIEGAGSPDTSHAASWEELDLRADDVDGVIIATMDDLHVGPALRFSQLGVPILLEKPIARTWEDCCRLESELGDHAPTILVAHVLRYAPYTRLLRSLIADGALGDIVNIHHFEPVGFWHFAHSFVRGNWHSTDDAAAFMVAKACHDVDWVMHIVDSDCVAVSSFASLNHFRTDSRPRNAAERCIECSVDCIYDARSIYLDPARDGDFSWPLEAVVTDHTVEAVSEALEHSRYGRCVYRGDNEMVDNQVVSMLFAGGQTATITLSAFTELRSRQTIISGTRAEATVTTAGVEIYSFADRRRQFLEAGGAAGSSIASSHGGGDRALVERFLSEIEAPTEAGRLAFSEALNTHRVTFAIEEARKRGKVVNPCELSGPRRTRSPSPSCKPDQTRSRS